MSSDTNEARTKKMDVIEIGSDEEASGCTGSESQVAEMTVLLKTIKSPLQPSHLTHRSSLYDNFNYSKMWVHGSIERAELQKSLSTVDEKRNKQLEPVSIINEKWTSRVKRWGK